MVLFYLYFLIFIQEVDIGLDPLPLDSLLISSMHMISSELKPLIAITGGFYPNTKSNSLFGIINIFNFEVNKSVFSIKVIKFVDN